MRTKFFLTAAALAILCQQPAHAEGAAPYSFERGYPAPDTTKRAHDDADFQRAMIARLFSVLATESSPGPYAFS